MKYMYYCPDCKKVYKAGETGKNIKCPKCESSLLDLGISDRDYAVLPAAEKDIIKQNMAVKADTERLAGKAKGLEAGSDRLTAILNKPEADSDGLAAILNVQEANSDRLAAILNNLEVDSDGLAGETKVLVNEDKLSKISEGVLNTALNANESLGAAISNNREILAQIKNNYLKMQIQNQILAADNFVSICTMSALKDDGKIDSDEAKLLKKLEKLTDEYKKGLNKLI